MVKKNYRFYKSSHQFLLSLWIFITLLEINPSNAENLAGCYFNQDSTANYLILLLPKGDYEHYIYTNSNQTVVSTGEWWQKDQTLFTKITFTTLRGEMGISRLVEGSIRELAIQSNGNLIANSKVYRPVSCYDYHHLIQQPDSNS